MNLGEKRPISNTRRKLLSAGAAVGIATALLAAAPTSAVAAGGGCLNYARSGWNIGVCSSDNGVRVSGDVYINARGSLGSSCVLIFGIFNITRDKTMVSTSVPCSLGRSPEIHTPKEAGHRYQNTALIEVNDNYVVGGVSKTTF
ncbi:hypothetical protein ACIBI9_65605 [Nonomuraea sp. NPDC050451]|uniref:hypothetical protein n=1 Tax=Nonomuraea sp. NPDC050451 TaxID=3364364 RepID=UPI0037B75593